MAGYDAAASPGPRIGSVGILVVAPSGSTPACGSKVRSFGASLYSPG
jgi:hypothetical protein